MFLLTLLNLLSYAYFGWKLYVFHLSAQILLAKMRGVVALMTVENGIKCVNVWALEFFFEGEL